MPVDVEADLREIAGGVGVVAAQLEVLSARLLDVALKMAGDLLATWRAPVDDAAAWYVATWHDPTGARNGGYKHTGIDLNLDRAPWGDVERGAPVYAMAAGRVVASDASRGWLGVVVVEHEYHGRPLYVRYAHLERRQVEEGVAVEAGTVLGFIGDWQGGDGGDHLHLDMASSSFLWSGWLTHGVAWVDPVPIMEDVLGAGVVAEMVRRGG